MEAMAEITESHWIGRNVPSSIKIKPTPILTAYKTTPTYDIPHDPSINNEKNGGDKHEHPKRNSTFF